MLYFTLQTCRSDLAILFGVDSRALLFVARERRPWLSIAIFPQLMQPDARVVLDIVRVNEPFAIAVAVEVSARGAPAGLHRTPGLEAGDAICRHSIIIKLGI